MQWDQLLCPERIRETGKGPRKGDLRSAYEKDYHRIIGSASFRRLQDKTQVFPLDKSDFVRTRLTHSLEVASFARSLGQTIGRNLSRESETTGFREENVGDISSILECAGLLHDIGNPPFGHFGETSIRAYFAKNLPLLTYIPEGGEEAVPLSAFLTRRHQEDFLHFEGNAQALRLVTKLHYLVDEHGMNLTKALLASIIKYPVSALEVDPGGPIRARKMGYFAADEDNFRNIERSCGLGGARHPLTYLLEAADDIAYHTADIEDALRKGFIDYHTLLEEVRSGGCGEAAADLERRYEAARDAGHTDAGSYAVRNWLVGVQSRLLSSAGAGFMEHYREIMEGAYPCDIFAGTGGERLNERLGEIADDYVFKSRAILNIEVAAHEILTDLLDRFVHAVIYFDTGKPISPLDMRLIRLISENYREVYHIYGRGKDDEERLYLRLMLVTDYVCGMTDSYADNLYQTLNGRIW